MLAAMLETASTALLSAELAVSRALLTAELAAFAPWARALEAARPPGPPPPKRCSGGGKRNSFWVPCSMNTSAVTMRKSPSIQGEYFVRVEVMERFTCCFGTLVSQSVDRSPAG